MGIRLLIADDDALIRESLKIIFESTGKFEVVGCVENGIKAVEMCLKEEIDVALLDIRMPVLNGVQATKEIVERTKTKPVILTTFADDEFIVEAIKNGAKGYMLKNTPPDKIINAVEMAFGGHPIIQEEILEKLKAGLTNSRATKLNKDEFTEREISIMELISQGFSNKEISEKLFITEGTVKNYITNILNKTGLQHRTQIAIYFLNNK